MPAQEDISFELERFEWASPDRLEVEGTWHGVRRRLPRATLVVEVDGERRRLRALPGESPGSPEGWVAAFAWKGEMPRLPGAELEVGRGIVVDLPRPRRSKATNAAAVEPLPATSRAEREAEVPGREEVERLLAVLAAARTEADDATARATAAEARAESLHERAEQAEAELAAADLPALRTRAAEAEAALEAAGVDTLHTRAAEAEAELDTLRAEATEATSELEKLRGEADAAAGDVSALRARAGEAEAEAERLRARAEEADDVPALRARAEEAEAELTALRAASDETPAAVPDLDRLRAELQSVERDRMALQAQLDTTAERLAAATDADRTETMPGPRTAAASRSQTGDAGDGGRFGHAGDDPRRSRPAQRTARRAADTDAEESTTPLGERISEWVTSLTGSRSEAQNGGTAEVKLADAPPSAKRADRPRVPRTSEATGAARTRRRSDRRAAVEHDSPSWILRAAAVGLLALLMLALVVIVLSLL